MERGHLRHITGKGGTGRHLEASGDIWEASGGVWEPSGRHLEVSGRHLGSIWEASGRPGLPRWPQSGLRCLRHQKHRKTISFPRFLAGAPRDGDKKIVFLYVSESKCIKNICFSMFFRATPGEPGERTDHRFSNKSARTPTAKDCLGNCVKVFTTPAVSS